MIVARKYDSGVRRGRKRVANDAVRNAINPHGRPICAVVRTKFPYLVEYKEAAAAAQVGTIAA